MITLDADRTRAIKVGPIRPLALALRTPCGHKLFGTVSGIANYLILLVPQTGFRTCDPVITNDVLYQLSYCGIWLKTHQK